MWVENSNFTDVARNGAPRFNPLSYEYEEWWREQRHRCINGYSVGGKYMTGKLYHHVNFFHIEMGEDKRKHLGIPYLRDLEWDFFPEFERARGYTGLDEKSGLPLYGNEAKGFFLIGGRGPGKSYWAASIMAHEYTFFKNNEIVLSAYESKYSGPLGDKIKLGLDNYIGDVEYLGIPYAAPFSHRRVKDNWGREVRSGYYQNKQLKGYNSRILHRLFKDNALACNGTRPSIHAFEEAGQFMNLVDSYNSSVECWMNGAIQFGTPFLLGTGGDMDGGSIEAQKMFYDPTTYNLMTYENTYEDSTDKVAYFIPGWKGWNQFKDSEGFTDEAKAKAESIKRRKKKQKGKDKRAYYQELQYQPNKPSEAFLVKSGSVYPIALLQERLAYLSAHKEERTLGMPGRLEFDLEGNIEWHPDNTIQPLDFPEEGNQDGCIVVWEAPEHDVPFQLYIAGTDPVRQDNAYYSDSVASTFVYKRFYHADATYDWPVAEYTARPATTSEYYTNLRKLLMWYEAKDLYENEVPGVKQFFEVKKCLHLLKEQPLIIKDIIPNSKVNRGYGTHMVQKLSDWMDLRVADWLLEEYAPGQCNVNKIYSVPLLKEMIRYSPDNRGRFNRIVAFKLCIMHDLEIHRHIVAYKQEDSEDNFFSKGYKKFGNKLVWA